jgi:predicted O-linked N-acetylglucosamine transferase (SPINDLY family)
VWLPDCYQANDRKRKAAAAVPARGACGLPEEGFVYCCFNNTFKILPEIFEVWMRILRAVPDSVLWLLETSAEARDNLRREAELGSVDPGRLCFAPFVANAEHLARHAHADLVLDTLPYNAHTTASDALWQGAPVLTCTGRSFAGRVATSLLASAGLSELAVGDLAAYEALAVRLAREPEALAGFKARLAAVRDRPLFDSPRLTRHIERAFEEMQRRHERGERPSFLDVRTLAAAPAAAPG